MGYQNSYALSLYGAKYINEFFSIGRLRLSSFALFAKHKDEQRGDFTEGRNILESSGEKHHIFAVTAHGQDAFILSTSIKEDKSLLDDFQCDGYFKIKDSANFGATIANHLAGFRQGFEGFCFYADQRVIERSIENFNILVDDLKNVNSTTNLNDIQEILPQIGKEDVFFLKLKRSQEQQDYRFI